MQFMQDVLTLTVVSTGLWDAHDLVGPTGAKVTAADAPVLGVARHPNTVVGDPGAVMVIGVARVKAVGAISAGARIVSANGGVAASGATPANAFAIALTAAADGQFVDILIR
jgi:hypothetical protein